ncbi:outer membrane beta-barrel protein [Marinilongibacter aquaticus]|uniref:outer membrane beta-barrel protein n=1 Tax=Marinilongibacter aquaticus TaxID=2975157 RepID=UPI0021BDD953|nr:outer membrane beta-barrel family protein [Marinilongibacter aquaticus]UBM59128.1 outer membrane beta-barrel protein [Marinilongibacter aquaticus]
MKKVKLFLLLLLWWRSEAQTHTFQISGTVRDMQNTALPGATISILQASDSLLVEGQISDAEGDFVTSILKPNRYILRVSSVGFKTYFSPVLEAESESNRMTLAPIFLLSQDDFLLKEVVVKAKKPLVEQDIDRTILNVQSLASTASSSTLEVIEKSPGLLVDENGNISLHGKSGVLVLVNGRNVYLQGNELSAYLKALPGAMLERLELMDNPPAKYDAAGGAVLNIVLKKNPNAGFTGNVNSGFSKGRTFRTLEAVSLNYRKEDLNVFGNLSYSQDANIEEETGDRHLFDENRQAISSVQMSNSYSYKSKGIQSRIGADYNLNTRTMLGFQAFYNNQPKKDKAHFRNEQTVYDPFQSTVSKGNNEGEYNWASYGGNLNFNRRFAQEGHELSMDANYIRYASDGRKLFFNYFEGDSLHEFDNRYVNGVDIYSFKSDYVRPLKKGSRFEMGFKSSYVKNDYDALFRNLENGVFVVDYSRSNHFVYTENINSGYASLRLTVNKRLAAQLGLRVENTQLKGELLPNEVAPQEVFRQSFTNLFPSVFLNYKMGAKEENALNVAFGRRINRPNYTQFNPFLNYIDVYTYSQGNTELRPFYLNSVNVRYQVKNIYSLGLGYDNARGIINEISVRRGDKFIRKPFNVGSGFKFGLDQNVNLQVSKFWRANVYFQFARFQLSGDADGHTGESMFYSMRFQLRNEFSFGQSWSIDFSGSVSARDRFYPTTTLGRRMFYASVQKKFWEDRASVRLSVDDPFLGNIRRLSTENFEQTDQFRKMVNDTRRVGLSFSYRFGNEKFSRKGGRNGNAVQEEQSRVGI